MGIDSTRGTEEVFRSSGIEPVRAQTLNARDYPETIQCGCRNNGPPPTTHRAVAVPWINQPVRKVDFELYASAMTRCRMSLLQFQIEGSCTMRLKLPMPYSGPSLSRRVSSKGFDKHIIDRR